MPLQTVQRYQVQQTGSPYAAWRFNHKIRIMPPGKTLRLELLQPARVHWTADGWQTIGDTETRDTGLGVWVADLPTEGLTPDKVVRFTFLWLQDRRWEGTDFSVQVEGEDETT
jgi:glucoamylase